MVNILYLFSAFLVIVDHLKRFTPQVLHSPIRTQAYIGGSDLLNLNLFIHSSSIVELRSHDFHDSQT